MTPKEKAQELYNKFHEWTPAEQALEHKYTKQCALICIEENIQILEMMSEDIPLPKSIGFLKEVKTEIRLL